MLCASGRKTLSPTLRLLALFCCVVYNADRLAAFYFPARADLCLGEPSVMVALSVYGKIELNSPYRLLALL